MGGRVTLRTLEKSHPLHLESKCSKSNYLLPTCYPIITYDITRGPGETYPTTDEDTIGDPKDGCSQIVIMWTETVHRFALRPTRVFCSGASDETEAYENCKYQEHNIHLNDICNGH